jgi:hypothetical protein
MLEIGHTRYLDRGVEHVRKLRSAQIWDSLMSRHLLQGGLYPKEVVAISEAVCFHVSMPPVQVKWSEPSKQVTYQHGQHGRELRTHSSAESLIGVLEGYSMLPLEA